MEQIGAESRRALYELWKRREQLGELKPALLKEYLELGNYPENVRYSLRDSLAHPKVELFADTQFWRPQESNEIFCLELEKLLDPSTLPPRLDDPGLHPLYRLAIALYDLESWHRQRGEVEAAFDARLELLSHLHENFTQDADRERIRKNLEERLSQLGDLPGKAGPGSRGAPLSL